MGGRIDAGGHAHGRPPHAVKPDDLLADHVVDRRPPHREPLVILAVADGGQVVDQCVVPDVEDVLLVPRHRHPPVDGGPGDRDVPEPATDETEGLVALGLGHHRGGCGLVPLDQLVLEGTQSEEVVLLLEQVHRGPVDGAQPALQQLVLGVVLLAGHAVEAAVGVLDDPSVLVDPGQELLDGALMPGLGGPDEVVVGNVQVGPGRGKAGSQLIRPLLGGDPMLLGRPGHLLAVLVGAGEEEDLIAEEPVPPGQGVGVDRRVGVAHVGRVVHVVDRRGDVEAGHCPAAYRSGRTPPS